MHFISLRPVENLKLVWERITASRIAIIFLVFSILNCAIQVVFQAQAYSTNEQADLFLSGLIRTGNATLPQGFFVLGSQLRFCDHVPKALSTESCQIVWESGKGNTTSDSSSGVKRVKSTAGTNTASHSPTAVVHSTPTTAPSSAEDTNAPSHRKRLSSQPQIDKTSSHRTTLKAQIGVELEGFGVNGEDVTLDQKCLEILNWPVQTLRNTKREDITFLAFQFWVLGLSLVALLNESIPHIIATVLTHLAATAWGGFQIYDTNVFHSDFKRVTTDGACHVNLLPNYWSTRARAEIPSLVFNAVALLVSSFLSFKLIKLFGWQTFKRVGASRTINRVYKLVLTLSTVIQLSLFFVVTAVALWIDQLYNGAIAVMATQSDTYQAFLTIVLILLIPWLLTGWFAARLEWKYPMTVFLTLSALYLVGWGLMFDSGTFRWTFVQWGFFGAMASASALLDIVGFVVGIMCRLNFDKGLVHYLNAQEPLRDSFIQTVPGEGNVSDEKFDFPSTLHPIPTFSFLSGSNGEAPLPGQMRFQAGPHVFIQQFDPPGDLESANSSHSTPPNTVPSGSNRTLTRNGSERSTSSEASSVMTMDAPIMERSRWVIE